MPLPTVRVPLLGGVNRLADPRSIGDGQVVKCQNVIPTKAGLATKRGAARYDSDGFLGDALLTKMVFPPWTGTRFVITDNQPNCAISAIAATTPYGTGVLGGKPNPRPSFVPWLNKLFVFGGPTCTKPGLVLEEDGNEAGGAKFSDFEFDGDNNGQVKPKVACVYRTRLAMANFGPGFENYVLFSDPLAPTIIGDDAMAANGRLFPVGEMTGDEIVGICEVMLSAVGTGVQAALLVMKRYSSYVITGAPTPTTSEVEDIFGDLEVSRYNFEVGCSSPDTITRTPYGTIWAGPNDVWFFEGGQLPRRVGTLIRPVLDETAENDKRWWFGEYHDGFYRLAVKPDNIDETAPFLWEQWWLDLRNGAPADASQARWYGPMIYALPGAADQVASVGTRVMAVDKRKGVGAALVGLEYGTFVGGAAGTALIRYDVQGESFDSALSPEAVAPAYQLGGEILIDVWDKDRDFDDPFVEKLYQGLELNIWNSRTFRLQVEAVVNGGQAVLSSTKDIEHTGLLVGIGTVGSVVSRQFSSVLVSPDEDTRVKGSSVQLKISDLNSIIIPSWATVFDFQYGATVRTATIVSGAYDSLLTFAGALAVAMNVAVGASVFTASLFTGGLIRITSSGSLWTPLTASLNPTSTLWLMALIGFETDTSYIYSVAASWTSVSSTYLTNSAAMEFGGMLARIRALPRRPAQ